jgi:hypothetical protein
MGWKEDAQKRIDENNKKRMETAGGGKWLKVEEGVLTVKVDADKEPGLKLGKYGNQHVIETIEPENGKIGMTDACFEAYVKGLAGQKGIVKINILRSGTSRVDTKYKVKVV